MKVVILPYCVSMWDSLAEYYYEYKDIAETYVIPIPYYGRNKNRELETFYYDGDKFPKDIEITDYKSVDLKVLHPDIIFFHNPYDGINTVTSVSPEYYSDKLKEYTDCLVYVPYFTTHWPIFDYMLRLPGAKNADKIIVESEEQKKQYLSALGRKNIEVRDSSKLMYLERKLSCDNLVIPDEWKEKLDNRKVVFLNTSLGALVDSKELYMPRLKKDLLNFESEKENVLVIWRPHPLFRQTIVSMMPELLAEYDSIVKWYKDKDFGIFDDTPDLQRTILLSDEYYGDGSSITCIFDYLQKPVKMR